MMVKKMKDVNKEKKIIKKRQIRKLYKDAFYYHLIRNEFTPEKAKFKVEQIFNSQK